MNRKALFSLLCLAGIGFSAWIFGPGTLSRAVRGGNDFAAFYTGGKLALSADLYHLNAFIHTQSALTGWRSDELVFVRMPWQALEFSPLSLLPYQPAHAVWTGICLLAILFFACCWNGIPARWRALCICWSIPLAMALIGGQDIPLLLAALAGGFLLLERDHEFAAGLCLSFCCLAKPHLFWPLCLVFLWHRRWTFIRGVSTGAGILTGVSFAIGGFSWVSSWMSAVAFIGGKANTGLMPNLHAIFAGTSWLEAGAILLLVTAMLQIRDLKTAAATALIVGVIASPHAFLSDCALVLPALFLVWENYRNRMVLIAASSPLAFIPCVAGYPAITALAMGISVLFLARPSFWPRRSGSINCAQSNAEPPEQLARAQA